MGYGIALASPYVDASSKECRCFSFDYVHTYHEAKVRTVNGSPARVPSFPANDVTALKHPSTAKGKEVVERQCANMDFINL